MIFGDWVDWPVGLPRTSEQAVLTTESGPGLVESGQIEQLLDKVANLMGREAMSISTSEVMGPCLEYLLEQDTLAHLVNYATTHQPNGIRLLVIKFVGNLITADQSLLIHSAINKPL